MSVLAALCYRAYRPFKAIVINNKFVIAANKRKATPTVSSASTPTASQAPATPTASTAAGTAGAAAGTGARLSMRASSLRVNRAVGYEGAQLIMSDVPESQRLHNNSELHEGTHVSDVDSDTRS
jgi:hypothetical protein